MKVLVVDDHALVRSGIRQVVQSLQSTDPVEVLEAEDGRQATQLLERNADVDLILLDHDLPEGTGMTWMTELGRDHPEIPVIMISGVANPTMVQVAMRKGASGFLTKSGDSQELLNAIREVMAGNTYVSAKLAPSRTGRNNKSGMPVLSERQLEVLRQLAQGLSNREIGERLYVSEETVK